VGNFSRDTFKEINHYVGVRLQQGVPIVDADWNELEDVRKYELRTFLKWFVGDGVPRGNDGFRIQALEEGSNDFVIQGGSPGLCLVDGWEVRIDEPRMQYTEQRLYNETTLADEWGVEPLNPLTPPTSGERTDVIYLDTWEREVNSDEKSEIKNPLIDIETCVRLKREWVVRVAEGVEVLSTPPAGHAYYHLARLQRRANQAEITADQIVDLRRTDLMLSNVQQIVTDAFGEDYQLNQGGQPNLKVSLREAINAALRGGCLVRRRLGFRGQEVVVRLGISLL